MRTGGRLSSLTVSTESPPYLREGRASPPCRRSCSHLGKARKPRVLRAFLLLESSLMLMLPTKAPQLMGRGSSAKSSKRTSTFWMSTVTLVKSRVVRGPLCRRFLSLPNTVGGCCPTCDSLFGRGRPTSCSVRRAIICTSSSLCAQISSRRQASLPRLLPGPRTTRTLRRVTFTLVDLRSSTTAVPASRSWLSVSESWESGSASCSALPVPSALEVVVERSDLPTALLEEASWRSTFSLASRSM
mmetsp:Transcript_18544/g.52370  ORF Transcript_18544/g.52370 Transcript_18544/m.52370 type:complete len:244 (-) Transcript_18544:902-1633(-)